MQYQVIVEAPRHSCSKPTCNHFKCTKAKLSHTMNQCAWIQKLQGIWNSFLGHSRLFLSTKGIYAVILVEFWQRSLVLSFVTSYTPLPMPSRQALISTRIRKTSTNAVHAHNVQNHGQSNSHITPYDKDMKLARLGIYHAHTIRQ